MKEKRASSDTVIVPVPEKFSYFYKFDDVKCSVANSGKKCPVSAIRFDKDDKILEWLISSSV